MRYKHVIIYNTNPISLLYRSSLIMQFKARTDADTMPYQYSSYLRGERTLQFYRNLNLEACIWEFENWFHMSELQQACGGEITTDGQVIQAIALDITLLESLLCRTRMLIERQF